MSSNAATWGAENSQQHGTLSLIQQAFQSFSRARAKRRTVAALSELDERTLRDIGVDPGMVRQLHRPSSDWVLQSHSGTARFVFIGR